MHYCDTPCMAASCCTHPDDSASRINPPRSCQFAVPLYSSPMIAETRLAVRSPQHCHQASPILANINPRPAKSRRNHTAFLMVFNDSLTATGKESPLPEILVLDTMVPIPGLDVVHSSNGSKRDMSLKKMNARHGDQRPCLISLPRRLARGRGWMLPAPTLPQEISPHALHQRMWVSGMSADDATDASHRRSILGTGVMQNNQLSTLTEVVRLCTAQKGREPRI